MQTESFENCIFIHQSWYIEQLLIIINIYDAKSYTVSVEPHITILKIDGMSGKKQLYIEVVG